MFVCVCCCFFINISYFCYFRFLWWPRGHPLFCSGALPVESLLKDSIRLLLSKLCVSVSGDRNSPPSVTHPSTNSIQWGGVVWISMSKWTTKWEIASITICLNSLIYTWKRLRRKKGSFEAWGRTYLHGRKVSPALAHVPQLVEHHSMHGKVASPIPSQAKNTKEGREWERDGGREEGR